MDAVGVLQRSNAAQGLLLDTSGGVVIHRGQSDLTVDYAPRRKSVMQPIQILVVAHQTAASGQLLSAVKERAALDSCRFTLLVPAAPHGLHRVVDPEDHGRCEARRAIEDALPALQAAAGGSVRAIVGSHDPLAAVQDAISRPLRRGDHLDATSSRVPLVTA